MLSSNRAIQSKSHKLHVVYYNGIYAEGMCLNMGIAIFYNNLN